MALVRFFLKPQLESGYDKWKGQTSKRLLEELSPTVDQERRKKLEALAESMDQLWIAYEVECASAAIEHAEAGGALSSYDEGYKKATQKGRSVSMVWMPPAGMGFEAGKVIELEFVLAFAMYPRMSALLKEFFSMQKEFDSLKG